MKKTTKRLKGLKVRPAESADITSIYECQLQAYAGLPKEALCSERLFSLQFSAFPQGVLVAEFENQVVGYATCLIVQLDDDSPWYSYDEITGGGAFTTQSPSGDTLYGADIAVHPEFRGRGVSKALYQGRKKLLRRLNLKRMVAGGRIPGYEQYADEMTAEDYVDKVIRGELSDPSLNAHLKAGYSVKSVHHGYLEDEQSLDYATFLEFENPHFRKDRHRISVTPLKRRHRKVRLCLVQSTPPEDVSQLSLFLGSKLEEASTLGSQLVLFPEHRWPTTEKVEEWEQVSEFVTAFCRKKSLFVAMPALSSESEVSLYGPSGLMGAQAKLHFGRRSETKSRGGTQLCLFDTQLARLAIVTGYDLMFPELARRLTLAGAQLLLCPVRTSERNEYLRLRHCAQARALENSIFVAFCNVGGDNSRSYGESVIFTPCDFGFPDSGLAARAGTFGSTLVVHDLDLGSLEAVREIGAVTPLLDRRTELCGLSSQVKVRTVKTED